MSNQALLWSILILPWLALFFMSKENIKRWMPVALFSALTSVLAVELGENLGWFVYGEAYPLSTPSYIIFGLNIVTTMWLFYFLHGQFWRYLIIDTVLNFVFIYLFHVYFLGSRGLFHEVGLTPLQNALIVTFDGVLAYGYQVWQEEVFARFEIKSASLSSKLQPAATKPLPEDHDNEKNE
jgi:predicted neutral ceramidase superfamily lipid hydrolase